MAMFADWSWKPPKKRKARKYVPIVHRERARAERDAQASELQDADMQDRDAALTLGKRWR